jgi:(p)ppGpp synthase/HD superfamily hydrolase
MTSEARDVPTVAQTNLQLFNQLQTADWCERDLARVKDAYALSVRILGSRFRPDGKPFLAHAIGTAGILASAACDVDVVLAGMLHAAYAWGDWGEGSHTMTNTKRAAVRDVVGVRAERIVAAYTRVPWGEAAAASLLERIDDLDDEERDMAALKVANALDDNLDLGMRYRGNTADMVADDRTVPRTVDLARGLGMTTLADQLQAARDAEIAADVLSALAFGGGYPQIPPLTHRRRFLVWLRAGDTHLSRTTQRAIRQLPRRVRRLATPR